jgi:hypothetical protein
LVNFQEMNWYIIHSLPTTFSTPWENMIRKTILSS